MRKHCPFAFSGLLRRLLAPQDRPFLLFPLSFPPYHQTTVTPQAPPAKRTHANSRRFFRPLHPSLRMDDKKARLPAGKRTFSSVQFWDYCRFAQNLPAVFTLKPCSDAQTASSTRERNLSFLSGKRTFSSVQFWDYCRFAQNLPAVFTLKPCSDAQTASSTRERNLSFLSVCLT